MALQSEEVLCVAGDAPAATHGAHAVFLNISNWPFRCVRKRGGGSRLLSRYQLAFLSYLLIQGCLLYRNNVTCGGPPVGCSLVPFAMRFFLQKLSLVLVLCRFFYLKKRLRFSVVLFLDFYYDHHPGRHHEYHHRHPHPEHFHDDNSDDDQHNICNFSDSNHHDYDHEDKSSKVPTTTPSNHHVPPPPQHDHDHRQQDHHHDCPQQTHRHNTTTLTP